MTAEQGTPRISDADRATGATVARAISLVAGAACVFSLAAAATLPADALATGAFVMAALTMAMTSVGSFGMLVHSPPATVRLLVLIHLICIGGVVAIAMGYVICIISLFYSAVMAILLSGSDWWPGAALDLPADAARLAPDRSFTRIFTALAAGGYLWLGLVALCFVLHPPAPVGIALIAGSGVLLSLFVRRLGKHIVAMRVESESNHRPG